MVGALDEGMTKICEEHGIPTLSIEANSIKNRGAANLRFDYSAYKRMAAMKVQFYSNILRLGFNVWACDADTAWMAHPAPSAREAPCGGGAQRHSCRREQAPFVNEYPMQYVDILTTTDCIDVEGDTKGGCWHVDHNTGLVYMRARQGVLDFTAAWKQKIETTRDVMIRDQAALNLLMREGFRSKEWEPPPDPQGGTRARPIYKAWNDRLKIARLPLRYFANGHTFFVQRMYARKEADGSDHPPPFALHMTYQCASPPPRQRHRRRPRRRTRPAPPPPPPPPPLPPPPSNRVGHEHPRSGRYGDSSKFAYGKRQRMREARVWWVDPPSYFSEGRYLAVAPEGAALPIDTLPNSVTTAEAAGRFNKEDSHLRETLRDALGLATALNRTLVLPRMLCYCDNIWKEMKHCKASPPPLALARPRPATPTRPRPSRWAVPLE